MTEKSTARQHPEGRLVIVSNRVAKPKKKSGAAGGLAVGVLAALRDQGGMWFGWSGKLTDESSDDAPKLVRKDNIDFATIALNRQDYEHYYNGYSNRVLWPVCHYMLGFIRYESADFEGYLRVNRRFARSLASLLEPDDVIWVHDYHLMPLASALRKAGIRNPIGFFLHVPFPCFEAFRAVPDHQFLLRALCAYDVLGFHTERDLDAFRNCVRQPGIGATVKEGNVIEVDGRTITADVFPIGIDVEDIQALSAEAQESKTVQRMVRSLNERKLIFSVDRLDYSKGLVQRFHSYERLLEKYPNAQDKVTLMQIAPPTRTGVRTYAEIRAELEQASGHINGRFAKSDWVPIRYLNKSISRKPLMGFFRNATVGLVTPLRDGMNLVAKEFVGAQDPEDPGVLVLSSLAGAASELTDAVIVHPYDRDSVADGIATAINMPVDERKRRHASMLAVLKKNDITAWRTRFVDALLASR